METRTIKYSDLLATWLVEQGYTTFYFVAGGGIMHILESFSRKMHGVPVVHEVAAGIAAEYFNETAVQGRAFALVTTGPGLTNIVTAIGGAWLEGRELLVIGGQVKMADLSRGQVRQRGIQEIDGVAIAEPITVISHLLDEVIDQNRFVKIIQTGSHGHKGPVFIEIPLDIQARPVHAASLTVPVTKPLSPFVPLDTGDKERLRALVEQAERPVLLIGGGVARETAAQIPYELMGIPVMTTYNGADRIGAENPFYFGRPNTWGQRYANLLLQQADLVIALGTRLGLQQTGFNWQEFVPVGILVQVDCDRSELDKGHPRVDWALCADANEVLNLLATFPTGDYKNWLEYCHMVKDKLSLSEDSNKTGTGYISPYEFSIKLSELCLADDIIIPCSSGGAFTSTFQAFNQKKGQIMFANKSSASMGYGLSGAIGAAMAGKGRRTILIEGDGGFAQNMQEIGTAAINRLNLKICIYMDNGYASIRMTQSNYFNGRYVGCDIATGLGLPDWEKLFAAWDVPVLTLKPGFEHDPVFLERFNRIGLDAFIVPIDPEQTYYPKITSRITADGGMMSNPLHRMSPDLDPDIYRQVSRYLSPLEE